MSLVSYSEFQEHRERRRTKISLLGEPPPRDDAMPMVASDTWTKPPAVEEVMDPGSQGPDEDEGER